MTRRTLTLALAPAAALLAAGCEPFVTAPGADDPPAVEAVRLGDTLAFLDSSSLSLEERAALPAELGPGVVVPAFEHPRVVFNKLMDGDTLEQVERDPATGHLLGNCRPQPGVYELLAGDAPVASLYACYDPSLRQTPLVPEDEAGEPLAFLRYDTTYTLRVTEAARDKRGQPLAPFDTTFTTGPFALFSAGDLSGELRVAGAAAGDPAPLPAGTDLVRLVFTGPVDAEELGALLDAEARVVTLPDGLPATATDADGNAHTARFRPAFPDGEPVGDPRVMLLHAPALAAGLDDPAFPPGRYRVTLPATMTDTGQVMGAPRPLGAEVSFELEIAAGPF